MDDVVLKVNKGQVAQGRRTRDRMVTAIGAFIADHGYSPTVRELGALVGLSSTSSVHAQLHTLAMQKRISWDPTRPRTVRLTNAPDQRCPKCGSRVEEVRP
jgi:repressor LexA